MALKHKITKAEWEKLPAEIKAEYSENSEGGYTLEVSGLDTGEDVGALRRAKDRESQDRKAAEKKLREAEERLARLEGDDARKNGDIDKLEKQWKEKLDAENARNGEIIKRHENYISRSLVDNVAESIAREISGSPKLLIPHIKARLSADLSGDSPVTKILDTSGNVSNMTLDQLRDEFKANPDFAQVITGSKASGGGAGGNGGGAAKPNRSGSDNTPPDYSRMSTKDLVDVIKAKKDDGN